MIDLPFKILAMTKHWLPLESNPDVLTAYAERLGMNEGQYRFEDVLAFEDWAIEMIPQPIVGAVFLFPLLPGDAGDPLESSATCDSSSDLFFTRQTIGNACGTIAILHLLANSGLFNRDSFVWKFKSQTEKMSPTERAAVLERSDDLEERHVEAQNLGQTEAVDEDVDTHFIGFVEKSGRLWELDGRKGSPVDHGEVGMSFLARVVQVIRENFVQHRPDELRFSLLALSKISTS
jgi:ubiquitin carboxyl-terminal hydrolase L3